MTAVLGAAVRHLADRWRESPTVQAVVSVIPRDGDSPKSPMAIMLSELQAMTMRGHPFRLSSELGYLLTQPIFDGVARPTEFDTWIQAAGKVEWAFRDQIAWVRAQLPGYPLLKVPQLVKNTPYTTLEFNWNALWPRNDMSRGFQLIPPPVTRIGHEIADMRKELVRVVTALNATEAWQRFTACRSNLTGSDWAELSSAARALRAALAPDQVHAYEPRRAIRRDQYRRQRMEDVLESFHGRTALYVQAFTDAADAVDFAIDEVMPRLVAHRAPRDIGAVSNLDCIDSVNVTFAPSVPVFRTGELVYISDPLVEEVGQVTKVHFAMEHGVSTQRLDVRLARGFAASWGL
jgi:hypothetical protein